MCVIDDETDMKELENNVRGIEQDGLVWGGSKLVAVGFGIKKLQMNLVIEDEKVSLDDLQEKIAEDEDHVQSTDVVSYSSVKNHTILRTNYDTQCRSLCRSCRHVCAWHGHLAYYMRTP